MAVVTMSAREIIEQSRAALVLNYPFFGTLAIYLNLAELEGGWCATAATDGNNLYYNPEWISQVAAEQGMRAVLGLIAHETMHAALGHIWRRENRVPILWNCACDYAVNAIIQACGMILPTGVLYEAKYENLSAEEIYARLAKNVVVVKMSEQSWDDHSAWDEAGQNETGQEDQDRDNKSGNVAASGSQDPSSLAEEWKLRVAASAQQARSQGKLPVGVERMVDAVVQPSVNWRTVLAEFLRRARFEYTFNPPDRRFIYDELYIPDYGGEGLVDIVVAVDTSGSIGTRELEDFMAECRAILAEGAISMHLVACDAEVHSWATLDSAADWADFKLAGGGGTDFRPVFQGIEERSIDAAALVYLTDGYGSAPREPPAYPVLWVLTPGGKEPCAWGRVVQILD